MKSLNDSLDECKKLNANSKLSQSYLKYFQRLKTFELFKWFAKPVEFSPIECARRGWINLNRDTLKCVACYNLLYFYTQPELNKPTFQHSNEKKTSLVMDPKMLVEKHNANCPWRTLIISDQLIQVDTIDEDKAYSSFSKLKEAYKKCESLPALNESAFKNFNWSSEARDKLFGSLMPKNKENIINILSVCGWSYKAEKDILVCEKCLRSIGLWMYKQDLNKEVLRENEISSQTVLKQCENNVSFVFANTEPYTDELIVQNVMNKIVATIELEQQKNLLSSLSGNVFSDISYPIKKRKLNELAEEPVAPNSFVSAANKIEESRSSKKKKFDPVAEHFNWCPWLSQVDSDQTRFLHVSDSKKHKLDSLNICQANFKAVNKYLEKNETHKIGINQKKIRSMSIASIIKNFSVNSTEETKKENEILSEKVKSIKSLLINCTSHFSD